MEKLAVKSHTPKTVSDYKYYSKVYIYFYLFKQFIQYTIYAAESWHNVAFI